jgi:PqqD family protein of HPr-rel-A system
MDTSSTFVVPESVAVSDSGFLFLASSGETFTLNPIGKEMFALLKEGVSLSAIKEKLLDEYDVEVTTLERDVEDFLNQLKTYKLVSNK